MCGKFYETEGRKEGDVATIKEDSCIDWIWNPWPLLLYE